MAKAIRTPETTIEVSALETLAVKLDALAAETERNGEERVAKSIRSAAKSARWAEQQRAARLKRVGGIVSAMKTKGLSDAEIVARLTTGRG